MAKYKLRLHGWELNASAHSLTNEQVEDLKEYQEENGNEDPSCRYFGHECNSIAN